MWGRLIKSNLRPLRTSRIGTFSRTAVSMYQTNHFDHNTFDQKASFNHQKSAFLLLFLLLLLLLLLALIMSKNWGEGMIVIAFELLIGSLTWRANLKLRTAFPVELKLLAKILFSLTRCAIWQPRYWMAHSVRRTADRLLREVAHSGRALKSSTTVLRSLWLAASENGLIHRRTPLLPFLSAWSNAKKGAHKSNSN